MAMFDPHSGKLQQVREAHHFAHLLQDVLKFLVLVLMVVDHAKRVLGLHEAALLLLGEGRFRYLRCCGVTTLQLGLSSQTDAHCRAIGEP